MRQRAALLAIDTSTDFAGIGLLEEDGAVALTWKAGRNQTVALLDQVDRCLRLAGVAQDELGGVVVASGPGMFTSLRVGISLAKGLAFALDLPIVGVPTLQVAALPWTGLGRDVIAVVAAGRGRVVWQRFKSFDAPVGAPVNTSTDELRIAALDGEPALVTGELPEELAADLRERRVWVRDGQDGRRDPLVLARLGDERFVREGGDNLAMLEPRYVHSRAGAAGGR